MDLDTILPDVGEFGTYQQLILYLVLLPGVLPCGFHAYNQIFMTASPDHWCRVPQLEERNLTLQQRLNFSIPIEEDGSFSKCKMYDRDYNEHFSAKNGENYSIIGCPHGWDYDFSQYINTVVTEWDIVCDKTFYTTLSLVLLGVGGLVGNYIFGYLQDSFGRRPSFFIYLFIQCVFGVATAFAKDFTTWMILRVGVGFTVPAILGTPYVLSIEMVGPKNRTLCTIMTNIAYSLGLVFLSAIVYLVRDWRQLALATSLPFLSFFFYWWVLPESPRWLLARGRFDEAEQVLKTMARVNGKVLPANYFVQLKRRYQVEMHMQEKEHQMADRTYGVMDLLRTPNLRRKTLIITFIWFTNTSVYVGLSYYAPALGGDEFLNFFLAGVVELPTYIFLWPAMDCWGRRWTLCLSMIIGGSACLATFLVQNDDLVTLCLYCIGKMGISSSYVVLPLMASELYPTVVRGLGMSFSSVVGMLGPTMIPLVNHLGADMLVLPLMVMGALLTVGGFFSLMLPETLHQSLPNSLEDGEEFGKNWQWMDCFTCRPPKKIPKVRKEPNLESPLQSLLERQEAFNAKGKEVSNSTGISTISASNSNTTAHEETYRITVI